MEESPLQNQTNDMIEMRGITKHFGSVVANENVNLTVRRGETVIGTCALPLHVLNTENNAALATAGETMIHSFLSRYYSGEGDTAGTLVFKRSLYLPARVPCLHLRENAAGEVDYTKAHCLRRSGAGGEPESAKRQAAHLRKALRNGEHTSSGS